MSIITIVVVDGLALGVSRYETRSIGPLAPDSDSRRDDDSCVITNCKSCIGLKRNNGCS